MPILSRAGLWSAIAAGACAPTINTRSRSMARGRDSDDGAVTSTIVVARTRAGISRHHGDGGQDSGEDN